MMVGGIRYEMVPLPDSMMDTTLFVGNFDEFVHVSLTLLGNMRNKEIFSHLCCVSLSHFTTNLPENKMDNRNLILFYSG